MAVAACGPTSSDRPGEVPSRAAAAADPVAATPSASADAPPAPNPPPAAGAVAADPAALPAGAELAAATSLEQVGGYRLHMGADGDLVLSWGAAVLWSTGTGGHPGARALLQPDGDFVVAGADGAVLWSAGTGGRGTVQVTISATGEIVAVDGTGPVWTAGTDGHRGRIEAVASPSGAHELRMQDDGNLVLHAGGSPIWATGTAGRAGAVAELQPDGNLVVSTPGDGVLWSSGTAGSGATEVAVTDAGQLELTTASGQRVWQVVGQPEPAAPGTPAGRTAPAPGAPASGSTSGPTSGPGEPAADPRPAAPPVSSDYGLAGSLIEEINAYRQSNGLGTLTVSGQLNGYAQACAAGMAAADAPLAHCRSGEIVQYNTYGSPHAWLVAFQNSPSHNAIMLLPGITLIGGGVTLSPGGRYYSVINVS